MNHRKPLRSLAILLCLAAPLVTGCEDTEDSPAEAPTTEAAPAQAAPERADVPEGWEEVEIQVGGNPVTVLAPTAERQLDTLNTVTTIYGDLPGQSYPYYFSIEHHDETPELRMIHSRPGLEREDTDFGFRAEVRTEDGNGWAYVVYNEAQNLSCNVSLNSSSGVSDDLIEEARRPCDRLAR